MSVEKIKKDYEKLKEKYTLPEFKDFTLIFGFPKDEDFESVLRLFIAVKKTPLNVAHWIMEHLSPSDAIASHESSFAKPMKEELLDAMRQFMIVDKKLVITSFSASQSDDPEKEMAVALNDAVFSLKDTSQVVLKFIKNCEKGWSEKSEEEEVSYRW